MSDGIVYRLFEKWWTVCFSGPPLNNLLNLLLYRISVRLTVLQSVKSNTMYSLREIKSYNVPAEFQLNFKKSLTSFVLVFFLLFQKAIIVLVWFIFNLKLLYFALRSIVAVIKRYLFASEIKLEGKHWQPFFE